MYSSVNKFIMGFELGGPLATLISSQKENYFNGIICLNPTFGLNTNNHNKLSTLTNILGTIITSMKVIKCISSNIDHDSNINIPTYNFINDIIDSANKGVNVLKVPSYFLHAEGDKHSSNEASSKFYDRLQITDKVYMLMDGIIYLILDLDTELIKEEKWKFFLNDIIFWMKIHSQ
jgi:esterase/lipase